ncbi:MAG TPA: LamG-like jellyroll fold domain-containing protein, partial [Polyangiaceae bacterium]
MRRLRLLAACTSLVALAALPLACFSSGSSPAGSGPDAGAHTDGGFAYDAGTHDATTADAPADAASETSPPVDAPAEAALEASVADVGSDSADATADSPAEAVADAPVDSPADSPAEASDASDASTCSILTGLVGYWPFEEGTGTTTADVSASANPGTLMNSPTWVTTVPPTPYANTHALSFDGVQTYVTMGNPAALQISGPLTLAAWFQSSASLGNYKMLVSKWWTGQSDATYAIYWQTGFGPSLGLNDGPVELSTAASTLYNDGAWHFIAGTWDGTNAVLYVDAVSVASSATDGGFGALQSTTYTFDVA